MNILVLRVSKLIAALGSLRSFSAIVKFRVLGSFEHRNIFLLQFKTIVDIGANRGQFSLAARQYSPSARIFSFEPLKIPASIFRKIFLNDDLTTIYEVAIGPQESILTIHISARDDSSSLLPISAAQINCFPGTEEVDVSEIRVSTLDSFLGEQDLIPPALLKIDVQGFEMEALKGCESVIDKFDFIYCECSFIELYSGQKLVHEVVDWLHRHHFNFIGVFNTAYDSSGQAIQADFLFKKALTGC
jgi:FkbM family methyltransferase